MLCITKKSRENCQGGFLGVSCLRKHLYRQTIYVPISDSAPSLISHQPRTRFGEFGALAAVEGDVGGERLAFQAVAGVNEAVAAAVDVGVVDLRGVADEHELRVSGHAGDDGFRFLGGELLGFVEDEESVRDRAAANITEGFDFQDSLLHEDFIGLLRGGGSGTGGFLLFPAWAERGGRAHEQIERVMDRLQPGPHFFVE